MMIWVLFAAGVLMFSFVVRPPARFAILVAVLIVVLAVFRATGGRGSASLSTTYVVIGMLAIGLLLSLRWQLFPWAFLPLVIYVGVGAWGFWGDVGIQLGAAVNLLFVIAAWAVGRFVSSFCGREPSGERTLVVLLLLMVVFELTVAVIQAAGVPIFSPGERTAELEGGRSNGTYSHPSEVGKVMTLTLVLLFPALGSTSLPTRRLAMFGVMLSVIPVLLSMSRANIIAIGAMILVWSFVQPREKRLSKRFVLPAVGGLVAMIFLDQILARFQEGAGEREHFMEVALIQFSQTPWFGVGPGNYIRVIGQWDPLTAEGWPVHNIFVLQAVELGIIGAVFFYLPIVLVAFGAIRRWRHRGKMGRYARSFVSYIPAFIAIGWTGWGWLAPGILAFAFFVFGFVQQQIRQLDEAEDGTVPSARSQTVV